MQTGTICLQISNLRAFITSATGQYFLAYMFRNSEMVEKNSKMSLIFYVPEETITEGTELWD